MMENSIFAMPFIFYVIFWIIVNGMVGALIGNQRGKKSEGIWLGILLGPIGWLIVALGEDLRPKCSECGGVVIEGAKKCKNCGSDLDHNVVVKQEIETNGIETPSGNLEEDICNAYAEILSSEMQKIGHALPDVEKEKIIEKLFYEREHLILSQKELRMYRRKFDG